MHSNSILIGGLHLGVLLLWRGLDGRLLNIYGRHGHDFLLHRSLDGHDLLLHGILYSHNLLLHGSLDGNDLLLDWRLHGGHDLLLSSAGLNGDDLLLRWGLGVEYPTLVTSVGGRYRFQDDWETPDTQLITYQFGDEASCSWEGRSCNGTPVDGFGVGTAFYGETGTLFISGGNEYRIADMGGKTGTSQKNSDAWFVGVTPKLVAGA